MRDSLAPMVPLSPWPRRRPPEPLPTGEGGRGRPGGAGGGGGGGRAPAPPPPPQPPSRVTWGARAASRGARGGRGGAVIGQRRAPAPARPAAPSRVPSGAAEGEPQRQRRSGALQRCGRAGASSALGWLRGRRGRRCDEERPGSAPAQALRKVSLAKAVIASRSVQRREEKGCGAMGPPAEQPQWEGESCSTLKVRREQPLSPLASSQGIGPRPPQNAQEAALQSPRSSQGISPQPHKTSQEPSPQCSQTAQGRAPQSSRSSQGISPLKPLREQPLDPHRGSAPQPPKISQGSSPQCPQTAQGISSSTPPKK